MPRDREGNVCGRGCASDGAAELKPGAMQQQEQTSRSVAAVSGTKSRHDQKGRVVLEKVDGDQNVCRLRDETCRWQERHGDFLETWES